MLDRFNENPVTEKREMNIKPYIKFLTTYSLLEKQVGLKLHLHCLLPITIIFGKLNDSFFRKIWLLQAMLFFYTI